MDKVLAQASCWCITVVDYTEKGVRRQLETKQNSVVHFYQSEENGVRKPRYSYASTRLTLL